ncbi:MAG: hypothetical protein V7731_01735 [Amphritea sp.]
MTTFEQIDTLTAQNETLLKENAELKQQLSDKPAGATLTIKQIIELAEFAGLAINEEMSVHHNDSDQLETELTIECGRKVKMEDGTTFNGTSVHFSEYPEEGSLPLEDAASVYTVLEP